MKPKNSIQKVKLDNRLVMALIKSFGYFSLNSLGQAEKFGKVSARLEGGQVRTMSKIVKVALNCNPQCTGQVARSVNTVFLTLKLKRLCFAGRISEQVHRYLLVLNGMFIDAVSLFDLNRDPLLANAGVCGQID